MAMSLPNDARRATGGDVHHAPPTSRPASARPEWCPAARRAMAMWPRLDRRALARCGSDTRRIASHVARRTLLPAKAIEALLERDF